MQKCKKPKSKMRFGRCVGLAGVWAAFGVALSRARGFAGIWWAWNRVLDLAFAWILA